MNAADSLVLDYLGARGGFTANQVNHLQNWWHAAREGVEPLCVFLLRQELVSESTVQLFRKIAGGHLTAPLGFALLDRRELDEFRRRLPDVAQTAGCDDIPDTLTLLSSQDTAVDAPAARTGSADAPRVGSMLDNYLLTEWIGQGANGTVYRALHPTLQIPVAVKVLQPLGNTPVRAEQLKAEACLLARLNHPNVVRLYDFVAHPIHPFLVLESVNGPTLAELIEHCGRIQPARAVLIIKQVADALAASHRLSVLHRDIKPANILLTRCGEVKLSDFGFAAARSARESPMPPDARVGTANFVAPEIVGSAAQPTERSDIYSLGATLYHSLTGRLPFPAATTWETIRLQLNCPPPCPRQIVPELSAELAELVVRMMARDPDRRPPNMGALLQESALQRQFIATANPVASNSSVWRRMMEKLRWKQARRQSA